MMYGFFSKVLEVAKEKHKKALEGKSNCQKKLHKELLEIQSNLQNSYKNKELTDEEYKKLAEGFSRISFINLSDQRKGKYY